MIVITESRYLSFTLFCREQNLIDILKELWTFTAVRQRMILQDSLATRKAGDVRPLFSLAKDAVLLSLGTNNSQERLAGPLVARLGGHLPETVLELLASYTGGSNYWLSVFCLIFNISGLEGENAEELEDGEEDDN